ncbi:MAG: amino acid ABC transporter permease [Rhodospirillaceae bacterium]|jgi:general L-amino acid transport system permease protein|nr:amino acid ABC transporter permease [Rhodospirillaceae bacterium]
MAEISAGPSGHSAAIVWWRDERKRALLWQVLVVAGVIAAIWFIASNTIENLRTLGVPLGLDFLDFPAGFAISFSLIPTDLDSSIGRLIVAGILNTLLATAICVVLSTFIGFLVGVLRLSGNYLISRLATVYVEAVRNVPLLVQLLFWYVAIVKFFPNVRQSISLNDMVFLSNRGIYAPRPVPQDDFSIVLVALAVGIAIAFGIRRWAKRRQEATGKQFPIGLSALGAILLLPILVSVLLGNPVEWELPALQGFNFQGGIVLQPELATLVIGLSIYTAAFIAEIVRGGILAISHGQTEAAYALGLRPSRTLRLVIVPQALRIIVPPLTSQYLNIAKNTTLAGAIAYPDIFSIIGTSLNQTGRAVENIAIMMGFFLLLSLIISWFMNWYNRRIALVER